MRIAIAGMAVMWLTTAASAQTFRGDIQGIVTMASGQPSNVNYLFEDDFNGSGEYFGRPDLVGDPLRDTGGADRFLDLTAFAAPCRPNGDGGCAGGQHFGNLPRNAFYGPAFHNLDLSLVKNTALGSGRATLQVRLDVFNVFNHPNFANPMLPYFAVDFLQNGIDPATNRGVGFLPLTATPDVGGGNPFLGGGGPRALQLSARVSCWRARGSRGRGRRCRRDPCGERCRVRDSRRSHTCRSAPRTGVADRLAGRDRRRGRVRTHPLFARDHRRPDRRRAHGTRADGRPSIAA